MITEYIHSGKDNTFTVEFTKDGVAYDLSPATKIEFTLNGTTVDSITNPTYFDFSTGTDGRIEFSLGGAGYVQNDSGLATIIAYDPVNTDGIVLASSCGEPTKLMVNVC